MISFFRQLNPFHILWLAIITLLVRVGCLVNPPANIDYTYVASFQHLLLLSAPVARLTPLANVLLAAAIVFVQALLLNRFANHFNLLGKPGFLPALMYVTLTALFTPFLVLSPALVCNFLIIWMLFKLVSFYKAKDSKTSAFDVGMMVAIGSLLYLPFVFFFIMIWIALVVFKPFNWREWATSVLGYTTVFFFLAVYYYLGDKLNHFGAIWLPLGTKFPDKIILSTYSYFLLVPVALILILCFVKLQQNFYKSIVQVRKVFQLLVILFIVGALTFFVKAAFLINHFVLCAVPAAIFFAYYFSHARIRWFYESLFLLLLALTIYFQFNTF